MKALESQIKEVDKTIKAQMELLPNVFPGLSLYTQPESWLKLVTSIVLTIRLHLLNMQALPGNNTSPVDLRPKLQGSFHAVTDF